MAPTWAVPAFLHTYFTYLSVFRDLMSFSKCLRRLFKKFRFIGSFHCFSKEQYFLAKGPLRIVLHFVMFSGSLYSTKEFLFRFHGFCWGKCKKILVLFCTFSDAPTFDVPSMFACIITYFINVYFTFAFF